jgi:hypothetical protein
VDIITAPIMQSLVDQTAGPCVSVYLPTHRAGREIQQDPIQFRNLLDQAEEDLSATGMRRPQARNLLEPARQLTRRRPFWEHQEDGLAVFVAPDRIETYRLPVRFDPFVSVTDAFHVKPLWSVVAGELFYILAISRNHVRLWWSDRYQIGDIDLPADIPKSLAEALWFDDTERQLQHHATARAGGGRVIAEFHGHGTPDERDVAKLERFLRAIDDGIRALIDPAAPLVLAGVKDITARYRQLSRHAAILGDTVVGSPNSLSTQELRARAGDLVEPMRVKAAAADAASFLAAGAPGVATVRDVVPAAATGRVAALFLPIDVHIWGSYDPGNMAVAVHESREPGDRDLLDLAAAATWCSGGSVYATDPADIPGGGTVAALLRY